MGTEQVAEEFGKFGYPQWFSYIVGLTEVGAALLLLSPAVARYAAAALIVVMVGAFFSHLKVGETSNAMLPLVLLVLLVIVGYLRRPQPI